MQAALWRTTMEKSSTAAWKTSKGSLFQALAGFNQGSGKLINVKVSATELNCSGTHGNSYAGGIAAENKGQISGWSWGNDGTLTGNKTGDCCPDAGNSGIITQ